MAEKANISFILARLGLSESEINLYLALLTHGALTAKELLKLTYTKRPTVYYALRQLSDRGLIYKSGGAGIERFSAEQPDKLLTSITFQHKELDDLEKQVRTIIPVLKKREVSQGEGIPSVSFYEGETAMKQAIMDTIYCHSGKIDCLTPADNFFWQVGQTFSQHYINERTAHQLKTRHLWEKPLPPELIRQSFAGLAEIKLLPSQMQGKFKTTVFIYDDCVMYVSSKTSGYVLLVKSKEHHQMMKALFDVLWSVSSDVSE